MRSLSEDEAKQFLAESSPRRSGKPKTRVREAIEALQPGENLLLEMGADYTHYRSAYWKIVGAQKETSRTFTYRTTVDKRKMLIIRLT